MIKNIASLFRKNAASLGENEIINSSEVVELLQKTKRESIPQSSHNQGAVFYSRIIMATGLEYKYAQNEERIVKSNVY